MDSTSHPTKIHRSLALTPPENWSTGPLTGFYRFVEAKSNLQFQTNTPDERVDFCGPISGEVEILQSINENANTVSFCLGSVTVRTHCRGQDFTRFILAMLVQYGREILKKNVDRFWLQASQERGDNPPLLLYRQKMKFCTVDVDAGDSCDPTQDWNHNATQKVTPKELDTWADKFDVKNRKFRPTKGANVAETPTMTAYREDFLKNHNRVLMPCTLMSLKVGPPQSQPRWITQKLVELRSKGWQMNFGQ